MKRCSGFCETHRRSMHACLEDGTAIKGSAPEARAKALGRDKLIATLRLQLRQVEHTVKSLGEVRDRALIALRRLAQ